MSLLLINVGDSHSGDADGTPVAGDAVGVRDGVIDWIGSSADGRAREYEQVLDLHGTTLIPGLIDSHVHSTFGDYTPRQQTIGFLESYVHGGTTTVISASEVHVPGRPRDVVGIKALAIAAAHSYADYRPGGMRVIAGSVILEPGLQRADFVELLEAGVHLAKAGFGAFARGEDYIPVVQAARDAGLLVMCHTGGGSIAGSQDKIGADLLLRMRPNIAGHVNGGPTALTREENTRVVREGEGIALQVVHAGNLLSALDLVDKILEDGQFHRLLLATDTPTGTGVIPLGMLRQIAELASLGSITPRQAVSASTGNVAAIYALSSGRLQVGAPADLVVLDAPTGSAARDAFGAFAIGDVPAVELVVTDGRVRVRPSRNAPRGPRPVSIVQ